jgi:hypothetical protein
LSRRLGVAAVLAAALLAACDTVNDAANTVGAVTDKASICVDALKLAGFYPDLGNPEQAVKDAKKTSEDLARLADQAADTTLRQALNDMSRKVGELGPGSIKPSTVTRWAADKVNTVDALTRACAA